jgi:hypothetical protein
MRVLLPCYQELSSCPSQPHIVTCSTSLPAMQQAAMHVRKMSKTITALSCMLSELRTENEALTEAHGQLLAKDLMAQGLLKDRYVAGLYARLQEAEWKLKTARMRALTWGQPMMVPFARCHRAIQTEVGEIWAAGGSVGQRKAHLLQQPQQHDMPTTPERLPAALVQILSAETRPDSGLVCCPTLASMRPYPKRHPASFCGHGSSDADRVGPDGLVMEKHRHGAAPVASSTGSDWRLQVEPLLASAPVMSAGALLRVIAQIRKRMATADAAAIINKQPRPQLAAVVHEHFGGLVGMLAQLVASVREHAQLVDVAQFASALDGACVLTGAAQAAHASVHQIQHERPSVGGDHPWHTHSHRKLLPTITKTILLPSVASQALASLSEIPCMDAWQAWISTVSFLQLVQRAGQLGHLLTDVQVRCLWHRHRVDSGC